jgi:hypothetical protein
MSLDEDYLKWKESLVHLQHKVLLPDHNYIDKTRWTSHNGFNQKGFDNYLKELYNAKYKKDEE